MNEYNAMHWYSSLRLSEESMNNLYNDTSEEPTIVPISGKTILYLAKSFCRDTKLVRKIPYLAQVKAECGIARDVAESAIKSHIFTEINRVHDIPRNSYTSRERIAFISPADGPLQEHIRERTSSP
ncbi:unnamed protein product [Arctia plantaginis]|uniref:Uncharacterized protein n=1 Tax=Arctia plantaginis TaxID=874455 RepID=A0A8S1BGH7_ARCPL|nr:unnamed protein product [Arctia plantaginis]CAB3258790.1 unnamed protein product [Arctia plantaginis]